MKQTLASGPCEFMDVQSTCHNAPTRSAVAQKCTGLTNLSSKLAMTSLPVLRRCRIRSLTCSDNIFQVIAVSACLVHLLDADNLKQD